MNPNAKRSVATLVAIICAVTLLIWAGVHNGRERRKQMQEAEANKVVLVPDSASGKKGAPVEDSAIPTMQGKSAPAFSLVDLDGKKVSLSDFKGKPVLVNFWATWCGPCKLEMPWLQEFQARYAAQGLVILGVSADDVGKPVIASTAHKLGVTYPILLKDDKVEEAYGGMNYLPESFYVDRSGKVLVETFGISEGGKDEIEANIHKLLDSAAR